MTELLLIKFFSGRDDGDDDKSMMIILYCIIDQPYGTDTFLKHKSLYEKSRQTIFIFSYEMI